MKNEIIEKAIDEIIDASSYTDEFKSQFKKYIKNMFDNNAVESDLKGVLNAIDDSVYGDEE